MSTVTKPASELPRFYVCDELRLVEEEGKPPVLKGYAAKYNSLSLDLGGFRERILPGAFDDALRSGAEVLALADHDPSRVLGRMSAGTLRLKSDEVGLFVEIDPPDTQVGKDAVTNVRRKDIKGMSFRFPPNPEETWALVDGEVVRTLSKLGLREVSITAIPAYEATEVYVRSHGVEAEAAQAFYKGKVDEVRAAETAKQAAKYDPVKAAERVRRMKLAQMDGSMRADPSHFTGETRCGGYYDDYGTLKSKLQNATYAARNAFDSAQNAIDKLTDADKDDWTDAAKAAALDAAEDAKRASARLLLFAEKVSAI